MEPPRTHANRRQLWQEFDSGWSTTAEFLSAVLAWMGIGWLLDRWLGTDPWLLAGGAFLGFALGMYLTYHRYRDRMARHAPPADADPDA